MLTARLCPFWAFSMFILSGNPFFQKYLTIGRMVLSGGAPSFAFQRIRMDLIFLLVMSPLGSPAFAFMLVLVKGDWSDAATGDESGGPTITSRLLHRI